MRDTERSNGDTEHSGRLARLIGTWDPEKWGANLATSILFYLVVWLAQGMPRSQLPVIGALFGVAVVYHVAMARLWSFVSARHVLFVASTGVYLLLFRWGLSTPAMLALPVLVLVNQPRVGTASAAALGMAVATLVVGVIAYRIYVQQNAQPTIDRVSVSGFGRPYPTITVKGSGFGDDPAFQSNHWPGAGQVSVYFQAQALVRRVDVAKEGREIEGGVQLSGR